MLSLPPLSLYIHIPWCVKKCPYCDFNSHESTAIPEDAYVNALKRDLEQDTHWIQGRKLHSIFFGGGTPSLFSAHSIARILNEAEKIIGFEDNIEITLEANPGTFEQQKFYDFYSSGINRLSIGIQSFQAKHLTSLGRIHNSDEAIQAVRIAQQAGFSNINLDLMHGLPQQSLTNAMTDLQTAIALSPQHISWYQLTIEPNTAFYRQPPPLPPDDTLADIQDHGLALLAEHHFHQYEVSAFAQTGRQSQHNINYWQFGDYIGIGAGAHGKFTDRHQQQIIRRQKTRLPEHYLADTITPSYKETIVKSTDLPLEFLMNTLRLNDGIDSHYFEERTGLPLTVIEPKLQVLIAKKLLMDTKDRIQTTILGQRFLNAVLTQLMND